MYQDTLLAHYRAPKNRREIVGATGSASRKNPLCGDAMRIMVRVVDDRVVDVAFTGTGCSIAVASASMMTTVLSGFSRADAIALAERVEAMLAGAEVTLPDGLAALRGVAPFSARHGCAVMAWRAMREAVMGGARQVQNSHI